MAIALHTELVSTSSRGISSPYWLRLVVALVVQDQITITLQNKFEIAVIGIYVLVDKQVVIRVKNKLSHVEGVRYSACVESSRTIELLVSDHHPEVRRGTLYLRSDAAEAAASMSTSMFMTQAVSRGSLHGLPVLNVHATIATAKPPVCFSDIDSYTLRRPRSDRSDEEC
jgi:hypothetical protein